MRHWPVIALAALCTSGATAQVRLFVNSAADPGGDGNSWPTAYNDLQDALDRAADPGNGVREVWVAQGEYHPDRATGDVSAAFNLPSGVMLLGGFDGTEFSRADRDWWRHRTILSGQLSATRSRHVVLAVNAGADTLLDGFVIQRGLASGAGLDGVGSGIYLEADGPQISHCIVSDNQSAQGGAVFMLESDAVLYCCLIVGNLTNGVRAESLESVLSPAAINCTILHNRILDRNSGPAIAFLSRGLDSGTPPMLVRNCVLYRNVPTPEGHYPDQLFGRFDAAYSWASESGYWPPGQGDPPPNCFYRDEHLTDVDGPDDVAGTIDDDARPALGSVCLDSGENAAIPADRFDLDDDGDTSEPTPYDLVRAERVYDAPQAPDTGAGSGPLVDLGAFEGPALAFVIDAPTLLVNEGASVEVAVSLSRPPAAVSTVTITRDGDQDLNASPDQLQFDADNWDEPQSIDLVADEDSDAFADQATFSITAPDFVTASFVATEAENDTPPGTIYVNHAAAGNNTGGSWENAFRRLQNALAFAAGSGGAVSEIWVAQGAYLPSTAASSFDLVNNVAVYGGFDGTEIAREQRDWSAHPTILSGDRANNDGPNFVNRSDNCLHVVRAGSAVGGAARLDGFVIRGGRAAGSGDDGRGAGAFIEYATIVIANCGFESCWADRDGGGLGIFYRAESSVTVDDSTFSGCRADLAGGGLYAYWLISPGGSIQVNGCSFTDNLAGETGGGGAYVRGGSVTIDDCIFERNTVTTASAFGSGLFLHVDEYDCSVTHSVFREHVQTLDYQQGAGAYIFGRGNIAVAGCTFEENVARGAGGGLFVREDLAHNLPLVMSDCTFSNNASGGGGGASVPGEPGSVVERCTFVGNTSTGSGGAFGGSRLIRDCVFDSNSAALSAGAAAINGLCENCLFTNNTAHGPGGPSVEYGGGAVVAGDQALFRYCLFIGNVTDGTDGAGGALLADGGGTRVFACTFTENRSSGMGGAVVALGASNGTVRVSHSFFGANEAPTGGAFWGNAQFSNCVFSGNTAATACGGLAGAWGPLTVANCTVVDNTAPLGGGLYRSFGAALIISNTVLWGNRSGQSGGQAGQYGSSSVEGQPTPIFNYDCVEGWTGSLGGSGNIGADPQFIDRLGPDGQPGTGDEILQLIAGSPCADAGSSSHVPADWFDLDEDLDTGESCPFDYAFASRYFDDPDAPDVGSGSPPLPDMGALESHPVQGLYNPCSADFDGDGFVTGLDFDFFVQEFEAGDPSADFDGDGFVTGLDFDAYVAEFEAGC